jgi:anaerobic dimethyl sulfoxide reductase subunit C (anchor subunit)
MEVRDWALIFFTILAQMSVGSFLTLGVVHYFAVRKAGEEQADRMSDGALLAIGPILVLGMFASLLHLGSPLAAYRAVSNLATSWLSREVLAGVLFAATGAVFAVMQWRKIASFAVRNIVAWIAAIIGLFLVYSMSSIYQIEAQPAWNTVATPISFFTTTLLLGVLGVGAALVANYRYVQRTDPDCAEAQCEMLRGALRWFAMAAIILLGIEVVVIPVQVAYLAAATERAAVASAELMYREYGVVLALRVALAFIGAGILGLFVYRNAVSAGRERILGNLAYSALALVLVAEVLGRFLFYMAHVRVGV